MVRPMSAFITQSGGRGARHHPSHRISALSLAFLFLAAATTTEAGALSIVTGKAIKEPSKRAVHESVEGSVWCLWCGMGAKRRLNGPGSSPPSCKAKCGRCAPCKPVNVPIQPGKTVPLEYYPEAWRCKCGNKLFMP
ncbi:hypothetical protein AMTR_s00002p00270870 [Amborella trichopoda]|uniref:Epidermal patterning factor-like protein n=1 Tax=Amborella trichopoda TaxID=13333 RepID=W1P1K3_AMBTC|nr:hypothetical protein AMTR_s00002p00270870 [Amborella trichopoda]